VDGFGAVEPVHGAAHGLEGVRQNPIVNLKIGCVVTMKSRVEIDCRDPQPGRQQDCRTPQTAGIEDRTHVEHTLQIHWMHI